jgi:uncharacterized membrane protein YczE
MEFHVTKLFLQFLRLILGLFLYALGIVLTIKANVGYGPWEVFHVGLGKTVGISIGTASILVGLAIVVLTVSMGERIGLGTVLNMLLIGIFIDLILGLDLIPLMANPYAGMAVLIAGLYAIAFGSYFYIGSRFGTGPRDGLMVALTRRTRLPIGVVRGSIEAAATLSGWLLGGMVGVGTVVSALAIGFCVQSAFALLRFDPTTIEHRSFPAPFRPRA